MAAPKTLKMKIEGRDCAALAAQNRSGAWREGRLSGNHHIWRYDTLDGNQRRYRGKRLCHG